jgi:hypothetical protein
MVEVGQIIQLLKIHFSKSSKILLLKIAQKNNLGDFILKIIANNLRNPKKYDNFALSF